MAKKQEKMIFNDETYISIGNLKKMLKQRWLGRNTKTKVLYVNGHKGIGKSQAVAQVAAELGRETGMDFQCLVMTLAAMEAPDFSGLPSVNPETLETVYGKPFFFPSDGAGFLFLDEANRAGSDLLQASLTLIENREINGHKLGKDWIIVLAGNPESVEGVNYQVNELDPALKDRLAFYTLRPTAKEVQEYLSDKYGASNLVVSWIKKDPSVIDFDGDKKTSPRALEYLIRALEVHDDMDPYLIASGEIGPKNAAAFRVFCDSPDALSWDELFKMTKRAEKIIAAAQQGDLRPELFAHWNQMIVDFATELRKSNGDRDFRYFDQNGHCLQPEFAEFLGWYISQMQRFEWWSSFKAAGRDIFGMIVPDGDKFRKYLVSKRQGLNTKISNMEKVEKDAIKAMEKKQASK